MRQIDIDDETIDTEAEGWKEFQTNGGFELAYGNGLVERFTKLMFGWHTEEYSASERMFGIWAGYEAEDGSLSDSFNVPDDVFEALFPTDDADWNCSESSHDFNCPDHETLAETMARVANTLSQAGFKWKP